jgi:hypothetical protein
MYRFRSLPLYGSPRLAADWSARTFTGHDRRLTAPAAKPSQIQHSVRHLPGPVAVRTAPHDARGGAGSSRRSQKPPYGGRVAPVAPPHRPLLPAGLEPGVASEGARLAHGQGQIELPSRVGGLAGAVGGD